MRRRRGAAVAAAVLVAVAVAPAQAGTPDAPDAVPERFRPVLTALLDPAPARPAASPAGAHQRLAAEVRRLGEALGQPPPGVDAALAPLPAAAAGELAVVLAAAAACHAVTSEALAPWQGRPPVVGGRLAALPAARAAAVRRCAADLDASVRTAAPRLAQDLPEVDLWPVLRVAGGHRDHVHAVDYAVLVDEAGDDRHLNAAGSNMLDLQRGPASGRARGCEQVFPDTTSGRVRRGPDGRRYVAQPAEWRPECVAAVGVLLDLQGDDTYGRREAPGFPDDQCTRDHVVRRIATQGAAFAGVGLLYDMDGRDTYTGKTLTQGAGHLGGVGVLRDEGGDPDRYLALRSAQGIGLLGGVGLLTDDGGDDRRDYYEARALVPGRPPQAEGSGGVNDDTGLGSEAGLGQHRDEDGRLDGEPGGSCDALPRSVQGVGLLGGVGALVDDHGDDRYRAPSARDQEFLRPLDGPLSVDLVHGSQGSGLFGGSGVLWDERGRDAYLEDRVPSASRRDGAVLAPTYRPGADPATGGSVDARLFVDRS